MKLMSEGENKEKTCWICRRTESEIEKQFGERLPFEEVKGSWRGLYVCYPCTEVIGDVMGKAGFACIEDIKDLFDAVAETVQKAARTMSEAAKEIQDMLEERVDKRFKKRMKRRK